MRQKALKMNNNNDKNNKLPETSQYSGMVEGAIRLLYRTKMHRTQKISDYSGTQPDKVSHRRPIRITNIGQPATLFAAMWHFRRISLARLLSPAAAKLQANASITVTLIARNYACHIIYTVLVVCRA